MLVVRRWRAASVPQAEVGTAQSGSKAPMTHIHQRHAANWGAPTLTPQRLDGR
jgi:hypothetical protein